jgi:predicted NUDIX family NTP pyrophosphohydrolase
LLCEDCGKDLRSCRNCRHYRSYGCTESQVEKPPESDRANFCDWFSMNPIFKNVTEGQKNSMDTVAADKSDAKSAFNDLFK